MRSTPVGLGIDVGTTNTKVVLADDSGPLASRSAPTPTDADALVGLVCSATREVVESTGRRPDAVGIASMAESGFLLDPDGRALGPLRSWRDTGDGRAVQAWARAHGGPDAVYAATGVRPGPKPPLAWWLDLPGSDPGLLAAAAHWAGVADLLHLALTSRLRTDHTLAGRTLAYRLPPAGEPLSNSFDADLLDGTRLTPSRLPRVGLPGEPLDPVSAAGAAATGLSAGTPVLVAGHDHQVAAWAGGVRAPGGVVHSVGTAEAVLTAVAAASDRPPLAHAGFSLARAVDGRTEVVLGGSPSSGAFLQWLADRETGGDVAALLAGAEAAPPSAWAGPAFWLPYPSGRQAPSPAPDAAPRLVGPPGAPAGVLALEAVSYQAQWLADTASGLTGSSPAHLVAVGEPLRRSTPWPRVKAALADLPTRLVAAAEPVATGAALLALVRAGLLPPDTTLPTSPVDPLPVPAGAYRVRLASFITQATTPTVTRGVP